MKVDSTTSVSIGPLIGTGLALGIVHVLTGPDHLSAVATLSATAGCSWQTFFLGVRWGLGHSTGLIVVGTIWIVLDEVARQQSEGGDESTIRIPETVSHVFEFSVGVFMLLLGLFGMERAYHRRRVQSAEYSELHLTTSTSLAVVDVTADAVVVPVADASDVEVGKETVTKDVDDKDEQVDNNDDNDKMTSVVMKEGVEEVEITGHGHEVSDDIGGSNSSCTNNSNNNNTNTSNCEGDGDVVANDNSDIVANDDDVKKNRRRCCCFSLQSCSTGTIALLAGIIHGMAGPGGVLGVLPAVQMHNWKLAAVYLSTFCISSTLIMGCFAVLYGTVTLCMVTRSSQELTDSDSDGDGEDDGEDDDRQERGQGQCEGNDDNDDTCQTTDNSRRIHHHGHHHSHFLPRRHHHHHSHSPRQHRRENQQKLIKRKFWMEFGSAVLSVVVGILWITLLALGKLDQVFP